jgi:hypothetical protein
VRDDLYLELGYRYDSSAVIAEPGDTGPADGELPHQHPRDVHGQPGFRAPHVFLHRDGVRVSTLDLFGRSFVMLAGADGGAWCDAARAAAGRLGVGLAAYLVADGDGVAAGVDRLTGDASGFLDAYGLSPGGAVLVRPDGVVAWRAADGTGATGATAQAMAGVLSRVLHREGA